MAFLGRGHYARRATAPARYRNGYGARTVKTEAGPRMTPHILRAFDALRPEEAWEKDQSAA